jgi:L(+)-tartrate dehydratase alpha subunit
MVRMHRDETDDLSRYVFGKILENYDKAKSERRPMCSDTGLPRFYVKLGNESVIEGGAVALESMIRKATADATYDIPFVPTGCIHSRERTTTTMSERTLLQ